MPKLGEIVQQKWNTKTLWNAHSTESDMREREEQEGGGRGKGEGGNTKTQSYVGWNTRTQGHVGCNTRTLWDAHSTQRHRGTETQREELNITLKKSNRIARMVKINRIVVF
jgi:hypothetical protein